MTTLSKNPENQNLRISTKPEIELILCCIRPEIDDVTTQKIQILVQKKIDWENLIHLAYTHGVIPLLYTRLNTICPKDISESTLQKFRSIFQSIATRNLFLTGELLKLLNFLKEQGIVAVPYKGPVLANLIYGNVALRQFVDLDILVQQQDIFAVKKLLISQGYQPKLEMTYAEELDYLRAKTEHTYDFFHPQKGILIEVHWRIAPKYVSSIEPKHLWQDIEPFSFAGTTISNLPLEDWIPILCVHGSRHMWIRLAWLCDLATLVQNHPNLNWEKVLELSQTLGCRRILCLGLYLVNHLFGVALPKETWQKITEDNIVPTLLPKIYNELFGEVRTSERFLGKSLYHLQVRERWQDKFLYIQSFLYWLIYRKGAKYLAFPLNHKVDNAKITHLTN